jgi:NmrA-like family
MSRKHIKVGVMMALSTGVTDAYSDIDTVISCVGRSVIAQQIPLIQWASETSVRRFFPSEYGTDIEYSPQSASEKPHQQKLKVRHYMATVKNLEWTYLVTGPYSDLYFASNRSRPEVGSFEVKEKRAWLLGDGKGRVSFTAMAEYDSSHGTPGMGLTAT